MMKPFAFTAYVILWAISTALPAVAAESRPNFLFIYTDDQRYDALGVVQREQKDQGRYPWFTTPHLDRLAAEGARFRNAFVTLSLCAPSRAVFLTGQYNHLNGIANNRTPFPDNSVTHATALRAAGYNTAYIGKWHMGGQRERPGFDYWASFIGQGRYVDCPFAVNGRSTPTKGWVDDVSTDYAIEYMRRNRDKPFSVVLGFKTCHSPTSPPERAENRFPGARAKAVPGLAVNAVYHPAEYASESRDMDANRTVPVNVNYFRCLSAMDDNVGRLLAALDELKLADNTMVIFTSDNGYYHGEHGLGDKRSGYEESLRIPLLVRYPARLKPGTILDEMVLNLDLAPTLLDYAGVKIPGTMQGRSWKPLLSGQPTTWRDAFLFEYFQERQFPNTPTLAGVRTRTAKLVQYPGHEDWTELFDLAADPFELKNLARDPSAKKLRAEMESVMKRQKEAVKFQIPDYADKLEPGTEMPARKFGKRRKKAAGKI